MYVHVRHSQCFGTGNTGCGIVNRAIRKERIYPISVFEKGQAQGPAPTNHSILIAKWNDSF
ncbi:MAG: hypothetical protein C0403_02785 [Desulfobacterium sp.]|nr:hypothetical protein [Desulfobacterium sp.]